MRLHDLVRRLEQEPGGPEPVREVVPAPLQLGGQPPVEHDDAPGGEQLGQGSAHRGNERVAHSSILNHGLGRIAR